jgi:hypothetical protein
MPYQRKPPMLIARNIKKRINPHRFPTNVIKFLRLSTTKNYRHAGQSSSRPREYSEQ